MIKHDFIMLVEIDDKLFLRIYGSTGLTTDIVLTTEKKIELIEGLAKSLRPKLK